MIRNSHKGIASAAITKLLPVISAAAGLLTVYCGDTKAVVITLHDRTQPQITLQVGSPGNQIDTVTFAVPNTNTGDGTPIKGAIAITINLGIRATAAKPITAFLTVDSSTPLNNGQGSTISVTQISWVASDGSIPSGTFAGSGDQLLASYTNSVRVIDRHTFYYANDTVYDAGTYTGQVTYTWFVP